MSNTRQGFDFRTLVESIGVTVRSVADSVSETVRPAAVLSESGLRTEVLSALKQGDKTGHEVITAIHESNDWGIKPPAAKVYPLLESLLDEKLVSVSLVKDRKVYSLTAEGVAAHESEQHTASHWSVPNVPGFDDDLVMASKRLAQVAFDVSRNGTAEQKAAAAKAIDDARRAIHNLLAAQ